MVGYVERGDVPGIVTLVSRRGEVHVDAIGMTAAGGRDPIRCDTIFRITSMTKPITAAATMILVEECKLRLDEPVDRLLPELAGRQVLKRLDGPLDDTVPANPRARLASAGRFKAIDGIRRRARFDALDDVAEQIDVAIVDAAVWEKDSVEDDRLRLVFTCCYAVWYHRDKRARDREVLPKKEI